MEKQSQINSERCSPEELLGWWATLRLNPFRLFFPLGITVGFVGVGLWVLWSVNWLAVPNVALSHAFLQSQGFLALFVVGFLMTAFPRFTGTDPVSWTEMGVGFFLGLSYFLLALRGAWIPSQVVFLLFILNLVVLAARRVPRRTKNLPPSFLLMGFGFLCAVGGTSLILASKFGMNHFPLFLAGRQMVQLGFLLCIVLGITGKLAPFLFGYTEDPEKENPLESEFRRGRKAIAIHALTGLLILTSFFIDLLSVRVGSFLRAIVVSAHLSFYARIARPLLKKTTLMTFFYVSTWMIPVGLWSAALFPSFRIASHHLVFIGGFGLMIFSFGMFIVFAHSRKAALLNEKLTMMKWIGGLTLVSVILRLCSEIFPNNYKSYIHSASGLWCAAALLWAIATFPKIRDGLEPKK